MPAIQVKDNLYKVGGFEIYDPEDEIWEFIPGTYVLVAEQNLDGENVLVAMQYMLKNSYGKYKCLCCGYFTLDEKTGNYFQICPVCFGEDDGVQANEPDIEGGANNVSLNQSKENFIRFGASEFEYLEAVRPPLDSEKPE